MKNFGLINPTPMGSYVQSKMDDIKQIFAANCPYDMLGWTDVHGIANKILVNQVQDIASQIRKDGDIFVLIGVGGSNQGARAAIKLLGDRKLKILYTGNNLSASAMQEIMDELKGKSVYVNAIAKNFQTLEPGVCFRIIRDYMLKTYGSKEAARRIITTGTEGQDHLWELSHEAGFTFLPFPGPVGGRFSVLSAVGLLPIAVAGIDITGLLSGADSYRQLIMKSPYDNDALTYAAQRNMLYEQGKKIEIMAYFQPELYYFAKWWVQLYGESEGKEGKGIYPTHCSYSEDLHSLGQYVQDGEKILFETFIRVESQPDFPIPDSNIQDGFDYLQGRGLGFLNDAAYKGVVEAHKAGGIPVIEFSLPEKSAFYLGQMFYFYMFSCYYSAVMLGVNPFDQPGVEAYKNSMFAILRK